MQERHARFQRGRLGDQRKIGGLLNGVGGEQRKTGRPSCHHVAVVAEDRQRMGSDRTGGDMNDRRRQLASDLIHVGDHQQQALRRGERRAQRTGLQRPMQRAGGAAFALHLDHVGHRAPNVRPGLGLPLIGPFGHGRGGGDRIDRDHLVQTVGHRSNGFVAVHDRALLVHGKLLRLVAKVRLRCSPWPEHGSMRWIKPGRRTAPEFIQRSRRCEAAPKRDATSPGCTCLNSL